MDMKQERNVVTLNANQQHYANLYYQDNGKRLHNIVDAQLKKYGGIYQEDMDDFYSLANEIFFQTLMEFNGSGTFEGYFKFKLSNKIKTEMTKRNRKKRGCVEIVNENGEKTQIFHRTISLDEPISDDSDCIYSDILCSDFNIDDYLIDETGSKYGKCISNYFKKLTSTQRKIALLLMHGYEHSDVAKELNMSEKKYRLILSDMRQFEKTIILRSLHNELN